MPKKWKIACFGGADEQRLARIREMGFHYCDVGDTCDGGSLHHWYDTTNTVNLDGNPFDMKRLADKYNLEIVDVAAHADLMGPPAIFRFGSTQIIKAIKFAADIDVPYVITSEGTHLEWGLTLDELFQQVKFSLKEPLRFAKDYGVKLCLEPHGPLTTKAEWLHKIFDAFGNSEWLGVNFDTGNYYLGGGDPVKGIASVIEKVYSLHLKEVPKGANRGIEFLDHKLRSRGCERAITFEEMTARGVAMGEGAVPFKEIAEILIDHGFDGPATLEIFGEDNILKSKEYLIKLGVFS